MHTGVRIFLIADESANEVPLPEDFYDPDADEEDEAWVAEQQQQAVGQFHTQLVR